MSIAAGTRLGVYEIGAAIGAGGMGEVYRARDTKLNRDVAIKVLPEIFAGDPARLARFEREAQTLAALNHPNIAAIYGVEGTALVMELVEGEDLSTIILRGALSIADALPIAKQIAEALEAAHEQGIVHRDLKPANIKVRANGTVKVLDFGLAMGRDGGSGSHPDIANSPTFTSPPPLTQLGVILGTAAYMSPEQARGKTVDRRADVWSFGCVLYEMLAGTKPFDGESVTDVLAAIVSRDPDWNRLPPATPARVRDVLHWCLRKNPSERLRDLADVRLLLAEAGEPDRAGPAAVPSARSALYRALMATGWLIAAGISAALLWTRFHVTEPAAPRSMRLELPLAPRVEARQQLVSSAFALSPDGARLVYVARQGNTTALFLRDLTTGEVRPIPDTAGAVAPFFSPDGTAVAFSAEDRLHALQLSGQLARDLAPSGTARATADWEAGGTLIFPEPRGLARIPVEGGTPAVVVSLLASEAGFLTPRALPDGRHLLVAVRTKTATHTDDTSQIAVVDTVTNEHRVLVERGGSPALLRDGTDARAPSFLVYALGGRLWAAKFDLARLAIGAPQPVVDNVDMRPNGDGAQFSVSTTGMLVYLEASHSELVWVTRAGAATPISASLRRFAMPRLAPDGQTLAVEVQDVPHQLWHLDPARDLLTPLTQGKEGSHNFAWSPDSRAIAFTTSAGPDSHIMWMPVDGSGAARELLSSKDGPSLFIEDWSPDGRWLAIVRRAMTATELQVAPLEPGSPPRIAGTPRTIVQSRESAVSSHFSPDSGWITWCDCPTGRLESTVFIARLSDARRYQVSTDGGAEPRWSPSGHELYFRKGTTMMAADVSLGDDVRIGRPHALFEGEYLEWGSADYDVARDGRFVMVRPAAASATGRALNVRLHWIEELRKLQF